MITVRRIMGVETEYALVDRDDLTADPDGLARRLLFAYARHAAAQGQPASQHVPADTGRVLLEGAGCRFDYSGELPTRDARDGADHELPAEARTEEEAGAVLTGTALTSADLTGSASARPSLAGSPTRWIRRVNAFESHYYRGSASHAVNGARLYVDHTHPEYSSPEVIGPRQAALYDMAGDLLMHRAEAALSQERGSRIQVIKNNTDGRGSAWGAHENYAVDREVDWELLTAVLLPFLATRQVIGGSGRIGLGPESQAPGFQIFQRADYVEQEISLYTTRERPIVNTRDEAHADPARWRRLHVITSDSSVLAVTTLLRMGSMAALLSLVEGYPQRARALAQRLALADPVAALKDFSHDPTLQARCRLVEGGSASALEIQRAFLDEIRVVAGTGADEETQEVLSLWGEALDALERGPQHAAHLVEWCAKLMVLEHLRSRYGCEWDDPRLRAADLRFSALDPAVSLAAALERNGTVRRVVEDGAVRRAVESAPADTRAGGRAALFEAFPDHVWAAGWTSLVVDTDARNLLRVSLPDPAYPTTADVERALAQARGTGGGASPDIAAVLGVLGVEVPEEPTIYAWDEGYYGQGDSEEE
ncbi:proteasome accessory factor PafA2 family protein [Actinomyces slackii]|uniref:Pup deamidase/depupylase n=1 Tax=Actinomyces slackii TaxID=52774 RepID=A0A3S5EMD1_9ACTO|nr:proteasome accessory factor PafA2 family protein [Actinomyces slackii]VEG75788.1 Pup deamidase/depupylase [Actinomyces slackii]